MSGSFNDVHLTSGHFQGLHITRMFYGRTLTRGHCTIKAYTGVSMTPILHPGLFELALDSFLVGIDSSFLFLTLTRDFGTRLTRFCQSRGFTSPTVTSPLFLLCKPDILLLSIFFHFLASDSAGNST